MIFRGKYQVLGLVAVMAIFCSVDAVMAQPGRGRGGSPFGQTSGLNLLGQEGIQQELELVEDQVESLKELQDEQRNSMREMFMGLRDQIQDMDEDERRELMTELQGKMKEMNKEFDAKADEVLLPHQTTRLKQLVAQNQNRRLGGGPGSGSFSPEAIEKLNISDEQLEKMKAKAEELQTTVAEKIAKIRKQAEEEILSILSAEQQAQYKEMIGDTYDFNQGNQGGGRGGQGGGDRGGRGGGDRGGRGGGDRGDRGGRPGADNGQRGDDF